jgi:quinol monooxygenase YgiN
MFTMMVYVHVKPEFLEEFKEAAIENASNSIKEEGITCFDLLQMADDPTRFILVETYKDSDASLRHKESDHYLRWRDRVAAMMAEPRTGIKYNHIYSPK